MKKKANVKLRDKPFPLSVPLKTSLQRWLKSEVLSWKVPWTCSSVTSGSLYYCFSDRMGLPRIKRIAEYRSLVQSVAEMPYLHQGDGGDMDCTLLATTKKEDIKVHFRWQRSGLLYKQRRVRQIHFLLVMDPFYCKPVAIQKLVSHNGTCEGGQQRPSRPCYPGVVRSWQNGS